MCRIVPFVGDCKGTETSERPDLGALAGGTDRILRVREVACAIVWPEGSLMSQGKDVCVLCRMKGQPLPGLWRGLPVLPFFALVMY